jgi:hypothetical protein
MSATHDELAERLVRAKRQVTEELAKQGTPEYDHRAYERAVEEERKVADELDKAGGAPA